ncbi:Sodium/glutamate symport protein [Klebsiella pneumoniae]|nr:Sodium/glutamate symport protein [Klebsiella pneumoniae]
MNSKTAAAFAFLGIIWGTNFIFMRQASEWISPVQIVFLRVLCGFVLRDPLIISPKRNHV